MFCVNTLGFCCFGIRSVYCRNRILDTDNTENSPEPALNHWHAICRWCALFLFRIFWKRVLLICVSNTNLNDMYRIVVIRWTRMIRTTRWGIRKLVLVYLEGGLGRGGYSVWESGKVHFWSNLFARRNRGKVQRFRIFTRTRRVRSTTVFARKWIEWINWESAIFECDGRCGYLVCRNYDVIGNVVYVNSRIECGVFELSLQNVLPFLMI